MPNEHYSVSFTLDQSAEQVYNAINNVTAWWSQDFAGKSKEQGDVFEVRFADVHYSRQELTNLIPNQKIEWLVTDSQLNFLKNKSEWNGTHIVFEISARDGKTLLTFTHFGLLPEIECFGACSGGWNYYLNQSLLPFVTTGHGKPNQK